MRKKVKMIKKLIQHDGSGPGYRGVTKINYGYMGRKSVNIDDVKEYLVKLGFNRISAVITYPSSILPSDKVEKVTIPIFNFKYVGFKPQLIISKFNQDIFHKLALSGTYFDIIIGDFKLICCVITHIEGFTNSYKSSVVFDTIKVGRYL